MRPMTRISSRWPVALICGALLAGCSPPGLALEWAAGVAAASLYFPAYRGSGDSALLAVPVPTFALSGENWRIGRNGAQLRLNESGRLKLQISMSGALPVNSDDSAARSGMPDLDPSLEIGPALVYTVPLRAGLELRGEGLLRAVIASDFKSATPTGWVANPRLTLKSHSAGDNSQLNLRLSSGPLWATRKYHGYYYDVTAEFATAQRPRFRARGGYSGWRNSLSSRWLRGRLGVYGLLSWDLLTGAGFVDSPLIERKSYVLFGLFISWNLARSSDRLASEDD